MTDQTRKWMQDALAEARQAFDSGEVPVGAIVVAKNKLISSAHNLTETTKDATAHAEILAIRQACEKLNSWRLTNASLYVTLEPCPMCIGAILLSHIHNLYFGCYDPKRGAVGSVFDLSKHPGLPDSVSVYPEVMAEEAQILLRDFFSEKVRAE